jgi:hypothetical protein
MAPFVSNPPQFLWKIRAEVAPRSRFRISDPTSRMPPHTPEGPGTACEIGAKGKNSIGILPVGGAHPRIASSISPIF